MKAKSREAIASVAICMRCAMKEKLSAAVNALAKEFRGLHWDFRQEEPDADLSERDIISYWPGSPDEDIMICALKSSRIDEPFHRQDFFFFNYAYRGSYCALSLKNDNLICVNEDECYIGQPYSGYALKSGGEGFDDYAGSSENYKFAGPASETDEDRDVIIVRVLVRREVFFREYLPTLASDNRMFRFFLEPQTNKKSEAFIHLKFSPDEPVRELVEMMVTEYAEHREDAQQILKPLVLSLIMQLARRHRENMEAKAEEPLTERMEHYIRDHMENVTLEQLAGAFNYHPNYISSLLREKAGKRFTDILIEKRMERSALLLERTELAVEEIAEMVGYKNNSSFYKAFKKYYGVTPRDYKRVPD